MNNHELYATLKREVGTTRRTVYYRDVIGTYGKTRDVYVPARIMKLNLDYTNDILKLKILLSINASIGYYESPMDNVSVADLYLPSPINSRFNGDMIPVRTYFEMQEREQGRDDTYDKYISDLRQQMVSAKIAANSVYGLGNRYRAKANFDYDKIIFSDPCTIIIWKDGTKTMARVSEGDTFDPEKGVAICFMKRALGHTETNKLLRKEFKQYWDEQKACAKEYIKDFHKCEKEGKD